MGFQTDAEREIYELHAFFEGWFTGALPDDARTFERLSTVIAPDFLYIFPGGTTATGHQVVERIRAAHGGHRACRIEIKNVDWRAIAGDTMGVVLFEEHQEVDGAHAARFNTALLRRNPATPNGIEWAHLHETWQAGKAPE